MFEDTQISMPVAPQVVTAMDYGQNKKSKDWQDATWSAQADAQNQLNMAKYNNEYNYWLWKMQTEYNSPENQVQRLKDAGLNPNFNSIEGAGNASSPSPSSGRLQSNFLGAYQAGISAKAQRLNEVNSVLSAFNDFVKNVGQGFDIYRTYVNTPSSGGLYRDSLATFMSNKASISAFDAGLKQIIYGVASGSDKPDFSGTPLGLALLGDYGSRAWNSQIAQQRFENLVKDGHLKDIVQSLKQYELSELQPKQKELLEKQIDNLFSRTNFVDTQNEMYSRLKVGGMLLPFALMLFKSLL